MSTLHAELENARKSAEEKETELSRVLTYSQQREQELQAQLLVRSEMHDQHDEGEENEDDCTKEFGKPLCFGCRLHQCSGLSVLVQYYQ